MADDTLNPTDDLVAMFSLRGEPALPPQVVPPTRTSPDKAAVYVMVRDDGARKIGISEGPVNRSRQVGRALLEREFWRETRREAYLIEQLAHRRLADYRVDGEWFTVTQGHASRTIMKAISDVQYSGEAAVPPSRVGKRAVTCWIEPQLHEMFRVAVMRQGDRIQGVLEGMITEWVRKNT